jgi:hypothetical protein
LKDGTKESYFIIMLIVGSTGGEITALTFDGCDAEDDDECEAAKGSTVVGQMTFKASAASPSLECSIYGVIFGLEVPFPGGCPVVDACSALSQGDCPIEAGEEFVYNLSMKIESIFPAVIRGYFFILFKTLDLIGFSTFSFRDL